MKTCQGLSRPAANSTFNRDSLPIAVLSSAYSDHLKRLYRRTAAGTARIHSVRF